jgi:hypothetical protein
MWLGVQGDPEIPYGVCISGSLWPKEVQAHTELELEPMGSTNTTCLILQSLWHRLYVGSKTVVFPSALQPFKMLYFFILAFNF